MGGRLFQAGLSPDLLEEVVEATQTQIIFVIEQGVEFGMQKALEEACGDCKGSLRAWREDEHNWFHVEPDGERAACAASGIHEALLVKKIQKLVHEHDYQENKKAS